MGISNYWCIERKHIQTSIWILCLTTHYIRSLGVIRTLLNRCQNVVTEEEDRRQEEEHITSALKKCSYPARSIRKANKTRRTRVIKESRKPVRKKELKSRGTVTIPCERVKWSVQSDIENIQDFFHSSKTTYYVEKSAGAPQRQNQWRGKARGGL